MQPHCRTPETHTGLLKLILDMDSQVDSGLDSTASLLITKSPKVCRQFVSHFRYIRRIINPYQPSLILPATG